MTILTTIMLDLCEISNLLNIISYTLQWSTNYYFATHSYSLLPNVQLIKTFDHISKNMHYLSLPAITSLSFFN